MTDKVRDLLVIFKRILEDAEEDKFSGEIELRLVYGQGGVRDLYETVRHRLNA